jgi:hypothetical protein
MEGRRPALKLPVRDPRKPSLLKSTHLGAARISLPRAPRESPGRRGKKTKLGRERT